MSDEIEKLFWRETVGAAASKAIGGVWVEFKGLPEASPLPQGVVVSVNERSALRISIKYSATGPYLAIEVAPGSGESMGTCIRTAGMVKDYEKILAAHNELGEFLHSARSFVLKATTETTG